MDNQNAGAAPATQMQDLDAVIEQKLDFVFHVSEEDDLLTLRSVLGFVRRLLHIRETYDAIPAELTIPMKREPRKIGQSLKQIVEDSDYSYRVSERIGYSIVTLEGASFSNIDTLISDCLLHVEASLAG